MTIPFSHIPSNIRVPLFYAELDASHANNAVETQRALLIGQKTSAADADVNELRLITSVAQAKARFGKGSQLALMYDAYRDEDPFGEVWCLPVADDGAAVAATGSFRFTAATTDNDGVLSLYIAGQKISQACVSTQSAADLATALTALINAATDLPVTAAVDGGVPSKVNLTAKNAGAAGNDIDIRVNYLGLAGGEKTPTGMTYTIVAMASGATNPTLTTALGNCTDKAFDFVAMPWTDTTSLNALKSFLDDITGRWSWSRQVYGHVFVAYRGTVGNRTTLGSGRNDQHATIMGFNDSPTPAWEWAASVCGAAAVSLRNDPARPLQTLPLTHVLAPPVKSRDSITDRNVLLYTGISTYVVSNDGTVRLDNVITTYQTNESGQADDSYLQVETLYTLAFLLRDLRTMVTSKYARVKIVANATRILPGSAMVTPNLIKADIIARYLEREAEGLVENGDEFRANLIVEQNAANKSRIDVLWPADLTSGLRVFALLAQFRQ